MGLLKQNFTLAQAQDAILRFSCKSTGAVSSYGLELSVTKPGDSSPLFTKTNIVGIAVTGSSGAWVISVTVLKANTTDVDIGVNYPYSLWRTDTASEYPMAVGDIIFESTSRSL